MRWIVDMYGTRTVSGVIRINVRGKHRTCITVFYYNIICIIGDWSRPACIRRPRACAAVYYHIFIHVGIERSAAAEELIVEVVWWVDVCVQAHHAFQFFRCNATVAAAQHNIIFFIFLYFIFFLLLLL